MNNFKRHDYKPSTKAGLFPMNSAYASARHSLIAIIAFTVINLILAFANSGTYFLMSISVPYYLVYLMMEVTGYFPDQII